MDINQEAKGIANDVSQEQDPFNAIELLGNKMNSAKTETPDSMGELSTAVAKELTDKGLLPKLSRAWASKNFDGIQSTEVQGTDAVDNAAALSTDEITKAASSGKFNGVEKAFLAQVGQDFDSLRGSNIDADDSQISANDLTQGIRFASLDLRNVNLQAELDKSQADNAGLKGEVGQLTTDLGAANTAKGKLEGQVSTLTEDLATANKANEGLTGDLAAAGSANDSLTTENGELKTANETISAEAQRSKQLLLQLAEQEVLENAITEVKPGEGYWQVAKRLLGGDAKNADISAASARLQDLNDNKALNPRDKLRVLSDEEIDTEMAQRVTAIDQYIAGTMQEEKGETELAENDDATKLEGEAVVTKMGGEGEKLEAAAVDGSEGELVEAKIEGEAEKAEAVKTEMEIKGGDGYWSLAQRSLGLEGNKAKGHAREIAEEMLRLQEINQHKELHPGQNIKLVADNAEMASNQESQEKGPSRMATLWKENAEALGTKPLLLDAKGNYKTTFGDSLSGIAERHLKMQGIDPTHEQLMFETERIAIANLDRYPQLRKSPDIAPHMTLQVVPKMAFEQMQPMPPQEITFRRPDQEIRPIELQGRVVHEEPKFRGLDLGIIRLGVQGNSLKLGANIGIANAGVSLGQETGVDAQVGTDEFGVKAGGGVAFRETGIHGDAGANLNLGELVGAGGDVNAQIGEELGVGVDAGAHVLTVGGDVAGKVGLNEADGLHAKYGVDARADKVLGVGSEGSFEISDDSHIGADAGFSIMDSKITAGGGIDTHGNTVLRPNVRLNGSDDEMASKLDLGVQVGKGLNLSADAGATETTQDGRSEDRAGVGIGVDGLGYRLVRQDGKLVYVKQNGWGQYSK